LNYILTGRELIINTSTKNSSFPIETTIACGNEGRRESPPFKEMGNKTRIGSEKKEGGWFGSCFEF
jgi:hypothetical protein